jgi:hypothetical protein
VRVTTIAVGRGVGVCSGVAVSLTKLCAEVTVGADAGLVGAGLVATGGAVGGTGVGVGSDLSHGKQLAKSAAASKAPASPLTRRTRPRIIPRSLCIATRESEPTACVTPYFNVKRYFTR